MWETYLNRFSYIRQLEDRLERLESTLGSVRLEELWFRCI